MTKIMVMTKVSIADLKSRLSEYLERVERGERIVICRHNRPVAELAPVETVRTEPRPLGRLAGRPAFEVSDAFHEPLSAVELEAWEGGALTGFGPGASRVSRVAERKGSYRTASAPRSRKTRPR